MKRTILNSVLSCAIILSFKLVGQTTIETNNIDAYSYRLYSESKWDSLIGLADRLSNEKSTFYYLEMRLGIAFFKKKNFFNAEKHFKKAIQLNSSEETALIYLYYCYFNLARENEARLLTKQLTDSSRIAIQQQKKYGISMIHLEAGFKRTDSLVYIDKFRNTYSNFFDPALIIQFGLKHYVGRRYWFYHSLNYFSQNNFTGKITQAHYFIKNDITLNKNYLLSVSANLINISLTQTVITQAPPTFTPGLPPPPPPRFKDTTKRNNYFSSSASVAKYFNRFYLQFGFTYTNLYNVNQLNNAFTCAYLPFGNTRLVIGNTAYLYSTDYFKTSYVANNTSVYIEPISRFSLKLEYFFNVKQNLVENNGLLVNNSPDLTRNRFSILPTIHLSQKISCYAMYQREYKTEYFQGFNYNYHLGSIGIKFNF